MADTVRSIEYLKSKFREKDAEYNGKPQQQDYWDWLASFRHKSEPITLTELDGYPIQVIPADTATDPADFGNPASTIIFVASDAGTYTNFLDASATPITIAANEAAFIVWDAVAEAYVKEVIPVDLTNYVAKSSVVIKPAGKNLFDKDAVIDGYYIDGTNGNTVANSSYKVSDIIAVEAGKQYLLGGSGTVHYGLGYVTKDSAGIVTGYGYLAYSDDSTPVVITAAASSATIQFTVKTANPSDNTDLENLQFEQSSSATSYEAYSARVSTVLGATAEYSQGQMLDVLETKIKDPRNLYDPSNNVDGYEVYYTNTIQVQASETYTKVPIDFASKYYVSGLPTGDTVNRGYNFLLSDGVTIMPNWDYIPNGDTEKLITPPFNAAYLVINLKGRNAGGDISSVRIEKSEWKTTNQDAIAEVAGEKLSIESNLAGAKFLLFGDSITETLDENGNVRENWPQYCFNSLKASWSNYARSGASFTDWAATNPRQQVSVQIDDAITAGETPDAIIVSLGTNDFQRVATLLGDYATAMGKASLAALDRTLVIEAMRYAFWKIKTQWPNAKCFYALPLQRADYEYEDMKTLLNEQRRMAERYNFISIEATTQSGIVKDFEVIGGAGRHLYDGLHPNPAGQRLQGELYARTILQHIK